MELEDSWPALSSQGQLFGPDDLPERRVGRQITGPWLGGGFIPSCTQVLPQAGPHSGMQRVGEAPQRDNIKTGKS